MSKVKGEKKSGEEQEQQEQRRNGAEGTTYREVEIFRRIKTKPMARRK